LAPAALSTAKILNMSVTVFFERAFWRRLVSIVSILVLNRESARTVVAKLQVGVGGGFKVVVGKTGKVGSTR
jgi:hypothetical protein